MEIIDSFTKKCNLEFKFVPSDQSDLETVWLSLYNECQQENRKIERKRVTVRKDKEKLRNILHMVKVYHQVVLDRSIAKKPTAISKTDNVMCKERDSDSKTCDDDVTQQSDQGQVCVLSF
ncbi:hypothetical protein GDO81_001077 [Engystomops pustulosus]|uniref:Uncharacterized protein n=1 Tax=Engystomops pustulosus TaxID=76066 RepID=A0AAV7D9N3_ENGPU|nr:hypothetical protein GDO81_001077 [Engystomops pustulosus]